MRKKERAAIVIERLKKEYPGADCTLDYNEAWKLLVSVRLAAQCTDERVNIIVKDLFAKYPGVNELAEAEPEDIEANVDLEKAKQEISVNVCVCCGMNSAQRYRITSRIS